MAVSHFAQKWILTTFMLINALITPGGIIYGWPGLVEMLKKESQFARGCENYDPDNAKCGSQDEALNNIFQAGANVATFSTIVYGFTLDRYGIRSNAISGALIMAGGFVLIALSDSEKFNAFLPGFCMVAFGGLGTYLPAFQFSSLFERPTRVLAAQSALFGAAGLVFTFLTFLYESAGVSRQTSYLAYAGLVLLCALNMALLYPAEAYKTGDQVHLPVLRWLGLDTDEAAPQKLVDQQDDDEVDGDLKGTVNGHGKKSPAGSPRDPDSVRGADYSPLMEDESLTANGSPSSSSSGPEPTKLDTLKNSGLDSPAISVSSSTELSKFDIEQLKAERKVRDLTPAEFEALKMSRTLKEEILYPGTTLVAMHFSVGLLCSNEYVSNIQSNLKDMGDSSGNFANAFVFISSLYPVLFAVAIDPLQRKFRYAGTSFLSTLLLIAGISFLFINNKYAQIPAFFLFATGRSLLITVMFTFVALQFRSDHYGRVIAYVTTICAIIGCLSFFLNWLQNNVANNDFTYFTAGMIIALTPLFYFSYWCHKNRV